ncbi:LOW QUALITY PROTEIN: pro-neuregulin-3, membrane-bound isoform [Myxocyprinus asiaticus]|uniref:LOW QUALITY PROTEIN: pro-neuregulin-3, membrane-bound isoform n=1 Tax=Myxocyprinus asiaticus TaxID=70543 RepID=UPI0022235DDB|nr:LOW QUALITY PROTEIN: pro-neuregulin-3, membrane-bound isoform [Myxocyprinus asiaticus]
MSDSSVNNSGAMVLEEPEGRGGSGGREQDQAPVRGGALRCGTCALWPRQQTWLCVVPLFIGFIGLGLSLMLLKWIVVGSVRDYVPTDLVDAKGIGQDPIFLSKPSTFPKGSDTTTTTTTIGGVSSVSPTVTTVLRGRTRTGSPPNIPARGGGASGSQVTQKSPTRFVTRNPTFTTTVASTTTSTVQTSTSSPSPSNPTVLNDSTQMWTREQSSTERHVTTPGRTHVNRKTPLPTLPPLKSEHFKPCQEKDLAYCLNEGECFVIETLSGPHKHCRCKEGFQGIRCDQFLPKTDSILSDPMDHLGIEFMESKEVHTRQVMSITCIAMGISFLGTLCMALYCRNKRRREKLQAHLKESRSQKNYNLNSSSLAPKPSLRLQQAMQLQKYYKPTKSSPPYGGTVRESSFTQNTAASSHPQGKHPRSSSLSHSPDQSCRPALRSASRKTPPITRGRLNAIGGSRDSGPAYQHLQEVDSSERESVRRNILGPVNDLHQDSFYNMQASQSSKSCSGQLDCRSARSLRSGPPSQCSPAPYRPCSIPIIPSVHSYQDEVSCMQTASTNGSSHSSASLESTVDGSAVIQQSNATVSNRVSGRRAEVASLLDKVQQLRALAHAQRKQEDIGGSIPQGAKETVCILLANGGEQGLVASFGPTETQLVSPRDTYKYATKTGQ